MENFLAYTGAIASIWLVIGVAIVGFFYPHYSHRNQFCSELGAADSPTEKLSPIVNNYPLGALFILFGAYVALQDIQNYPWVVIGILIVFHGLGTWITGFFPMDKNPYTTQPTLDCKIHSIAGIVMLGSLLIAPAIVCFTDTFTIWFRFYSVICIVGAVFFTIALAQAYKKKLNVGLYQRLGYGFQLAWLFVYSLLVAS